MCSHCGKAFARPYAFPCLTILLSLLRKAHRSDILKRHVAGHAEQQQQQQAESVNGASGDLNKDSPGAHDGTQHNSAQNNSEAAASTTKGRPRPFRACTPCAEGKLRCDGLSRPCVRCRQKSLLCDLPIQIPTLLEATPVASLLAPDCATGGLIQQNRHSSHSEQISDKVYADSLHESGAPNNAGDRVEYDDIFDGLALGVSFPFDILDFGTDLAFHFDDLDSYHFGTGDLSSVNLNSASEQHADEMSLPTASGTQTPGGRRPLNLGLSAQAFRDSVWLWSPSEQDRSLVDVDLAGVLLPQDDDRVVTPETIDLARLQEHISEATRSKMLALVLSTGDRNTFSHMVHNFPGTALITRLIHNFIGFHIQQEMSWIHLSSLSLNEEEPIFLLMMVAYAAAMSRIPNVRRLGSALNEAVRVAVQDKVINLTGVDIK